MALSGIPLATVRCSGHIAFRYRKDREYRCTVAATGLLLHPAPAGREISSTGLATAFSPSLWASLASPTFWPVASTSTPLHSLAKLVVQADHAPSVSPRKLGGDPNKALGRGTRRRHALNASLLDGLRYLLKEGNSKLNSPQASDGWLTQGRALAAVSKTSRQACGRICISGH